MSENNVPNMDGNEELNNEAQNNEELNAAYTAEEPEELDQTAENAAEETGEAGFESDAAGFDSEAIDFDAAAPEDAAFAAPEAEIAAAPAVVKKTNPVFLIIAIILAVLLVVSILTNGFRTLFPNKYNEMGYPADDLTIQQIADSCGMTLQEFLAACKLPADMPGSTRQSAAIYALPTSVFASMSNLTFDQVKEMLELPDTVTGDTMWNDAQGEASLNAYVGEEEALAQFKENYNLGDDVTGQTTWKEVRDAVYQQDMMDQATSQWQQIMAVIEETEQAEASPEPSASADASASPEASPEATEAADDAAAETAAEDAPTETPAE